MPTARASRRSWRCALDARRCALDARRRALGARLHALGAGLAALLCGATLCGCGKKKPEPETIAAPAPGGASLEMVATGIGMGVALEASLAPTSTQWQRAFVLDENRAIIVGRSLDVAIALRTEDGGRSWVSLKGEAAASIGWSVTAEGALVLASGRRAKPSAKDKTGPIDGVKMYFAGPQATDPTGPITLFPAEGLLKTATVPPGPFGPIALSGELGGMLVTLGPRKLAMAYCAPAGKPAPEPGLWTIGEDAVAVPYGRPPSLLTVKGASLFVRPWPKPGEPVPVATPIPGFIADRDSARQLGEGPSCDAGEWSFQRVTQAPSASWLVGISPTRSFAVKLPAGNSALLGCSADAVVLQSEEEKTGVPQLIRCGLDGKCVSPKSPPFRVWPEKSDRQIRAVPTAQGVVGVLSARAGARWGLYLAQSSDPGGLYELPRAIGEGSSERGVLESGVLVALPKRVLLLVTADVTGTTRRGWYVLASGDGGTNWGPP